MTNDKTMWTEITRAQRRRKGLRYSSDMTDAEWAVIEPLLPAARRLGRPRTVNVREIVNGILISGDLRAPVAATAEGFPADDDGATLCLPSARRWTPGDNQSRPGGDGSGKHGTGSQPNSGGDDSQSAKTTEAGGPQGYDAGKRIEGRKRHVLTDTNGLMVAAIESDVA